MRIAACAVLAAVLALAAGGAPPPLASAAAAVPLVVDWTLRPAAIGTSCHAQIDRADARISALIRARSAGTFGSVVLPLETIVADLNDTPAAQQFLTNVSTDKAVRDASQACNSAESAFDKMIAARYLDYALETPSRFCTRRST